MCSPSCFDQWSRLLALADVGRENGMSRRRFFAVATAPIVAAACGTVSTPPSGPTREMLDSTLSFDLHAHPGLFQSLSNDTFEGHRRAAEAGLVKLISLTATSDAPVLGRNSRGGLYAVREPLPGELYASMYRQLATLTGWSARSGMPTVRSVEAAAEVSASPVRGLLAVEGCDFLDGRIERIQEAFERGIRSLQLVHYRVNELGDIQTAAPVHGGLTGFGRAAVREMNRLGIVVDVAHATYDVVAGVVDTTKQPIILSHSNIQDASGWARFISPDHARLVAKTGGIIGAMPIIFGRRADDVGGYVRYVSRLVDVVGIDHVGLGTDMDGIGPGAIFTSYTRWPSLAAALLDHGYGREDVAKILGGNAQRVFRQVEAVSKSS